MQEPSVGFPGFNSSFIYSVCCSQDLKSGYLIILLKKINKKTKSPLLPYADGIKANSLPWYKSLCETCFLFTVRMPSPPSSLIPPSLPPCLLCCSPMQIFPPVPQHTISFLSHSTLYLTLVENRGGYQKYHLLIALNLPSM